MAESEYAATGDWGGPVPAPPAQTTPEQATTLPAAAPAASPPSESPAAPKAAPEPSTGPNPTQQEQARAIADLQATASDLQRRVQHLESAAATAPAPAPAGGGAGEEKSAVDVWRAKAQQQAEAQGQPQAREMMGAEPADEATMHAQFRGTEDASLSQVDAQPLGGQLASPIRAS